MNVYGYRPMTVGGLDSICGPWIRITNDEAQTGPNVMREQASANQISET